MMNLNPIYPFPRTNKRGAGASHNAYPYLLDGLAIDRPNQVWTSEIPDITMAASWSA